MQEMNDNSNKRTYSQSGMVQSEEQLALNPNKKQSLSSIGIMSDSEFHAFFQRIHRVPQKYSQQIQQYPTTFSQGYPQQNQQPPVQRYSVTIPQECFQQNQQHPIQQYPTAFSLGNLQQDQQHPIQWYPTTFSQGNPQQNQQQFVQRSPNTFPQAYPQQLRQQPVQSSGLIMQRKGEDNNVLRSLQRGIVPSEEELAMNPPSVDEIVSLNDRGIQAYLMHFLTESDQRVLSRKLVEKEFGRTHSPQSTNTNQKNPVLTQRNEQPKKDDSDASKQSMPGVSDDSNTASNKENNPKRSKKVIDQFSYDPCTKSLNMPILKREKEIEEICKVLFSVTPNVLLVGPAKSGKTSVITKLAQSIKNGDIPEVFKKLEIREIDLQRLTVICATERKPPLKSFEQIINEVKKSVAPDKKIVYFISHLSQVVSSRTPVGVNFINFLQLLMRDGKRFIFSENIQDINRFQQLGNAFTQYIQTVKIGHLPSESMHQRLKTEYIDNHKYDIPITEEAIKSVISLSNHYFKENSPIQKSREILDSLIFNRVWNSQQDSESSNTITEKHVWEAVAKKVGIPSKMLEKGPAISETSLEKILAKRIIGQDHAIAEVANSIKRAKIGLNDPRKPVGVFLFIGPTGVGKTELAKAISQEVFGSEDNFIRIDMTEYGEKFQVSRLWGSAPGYVGYQDGGVLTSALKNNPCSVVLLDEIEKAHPDVIHAFLPIFDVGRIRSPKGELIDGKKAIFIMTSNVGAEDIFKLIQSGKTISTEIIVKTIKDKLIKLFKPEGYSRIQSVVPFLPITVDKFRNIVKLKVDELVKYIYKVKRIEISVSKKVIDLLTNKYHSLEHGVRPLKRGIDELRNIVADKIVQSPISQESEIKITLDKEAKLLATICRKGTKVSESKISETPQTFFENKAININSESLSRLIDQGVSLKTINTDQTPPEFNK